MNHEVRIRINASPDVVWETLADVERWPEWTRSVRSVELLDGTLADGHRVRIRQPKLPSLAWTSTAVLALTQTGLLGTLVALASRRITTRYVALEAAGLKERSEYHARRSP